MTLLGSALEKEGGHLVSLVSSLVSASDPSSSHIDWIVNDPQLICSVVRETMPIY